MAVVIGGLGGIGAFMVKGLVSKGVKVTVINILPLSEDLRDYIFHKSTTPSCLIANAFTSG